MRHETPPRQLTLFPVDSPTWESLPSERQAGLQELLSLLLEQMLHAESLQSLCDQPAQTAEKNDV